MIRTTLAILLLAASSAPPPASAQPDDPADPADLQIDDAERLVPRAPADLQTFSPVRAETNEPVRPGLTAGQDWAAMLEPTWPGAVGTPLLPERTFLNGVRGTVLRGPNDTRIFVPETGEIPAAAPANADPAAAAADSSTPAAATFPRAMLLLPCTVLERFDTYTLADSQRVAVTLSGQVFLYNDRNYVLPTLIQTGRAGATAASTRSRTADRPDEPGAQQIIADGGPGAGDADSSDSTEPTGQADGRPDPLAENPDVAALMSELERHNPIARSATRAAPASPSPEDADGSHADRDADADAAPDPAAGPIEDGGYIASKRGRVVRLPEGVWSFVADNDDPSTARAYTLLPCRTLEALERRAFYRGDAVAGIVSGRVYHYDGTDYLLPTLYQTEHRTGVDPLQ